MAAKREGKKKEPALVTSQEVVTTPSEEPASQEETTLAVPAPSWAANVLRERAQVLREMKATIANRLAATIAEVGGYGEVEVEELPEPHRALGDGPKERFIKFHHRILIDKAPSVLVAV
ncbi:MAG TPA: hypothetical protein VEI97_20430, partial [bacterium]|nr:hypothetical protein [bacterium]